MKANSIFLRNAPGIIFAVLLFVYLFADKPPNLLFRSASAAKTGNFQKQIQRVDYDEGFVISYENGQDGQATCRDATPEEARAMARRDPALQLRAIRPLTYDLEQQQTGLKIILRGTPQLDGFPAAKAAFIRAAAKWEALIQDPITVIIDVDFGPTRFGQPFGSANTIGSTSGQSLLLSTEYPDLRLSLISLASNPLETALFASLPNGAVPTDIGSAAGFIATSSTLRVLGALPLVADPDSERQRGFGDPPNIGFNSAFDFDFDPSDGIGSNQTDFDSVAVHEIGHLLGFTSNVGAKEINANSNGANFPTVWDIFRFRPGVSVATFSTAQRILSSGGDQVFFDSGAELGLSTGRPNGQGGDGKQSSHWKADELSGAYIGIMDPSISRGRRDPITDNDLRVLNVLGYRLRTTADAPGTRPVISASAAVDFGVVPSNTRVDRLLTIRNTGTAALSVTGVNGQSPFSVVTVSNSNSFIVPPGMQESIIVRLNPAGAGNITSAISIASNDVAISVPVGVTVSDAARPPLTTVSAASFIGPILSSEAIVAGGGANLATGQQAATTVPLPTTLAGTTIRVRDFAGTQRDAPLFFVSPNQINYQIPPGTEFGQATITAISGSGVVSSGSVNIVPAAPGLFAANAAGQGVVAAIVLRIRADGSQVFEPVARFDGSRFVSVPIDLGSGSDQVFLILFGTGIRGRTNLSSVTATVGGVATEVLFAGPQGGVGLDQVNLRLTTGLPRGEINVMLDIGGARSNVVTVNLR